MAEFAAADHPVLQYELGRLEADFKAARAYLLTETAAYWERAKAGAPLAGTREQHDTLQATMWAVETCVKVVLGCHTLAGTRAIFDSQAIQRRLRDITTLRHHTLTHFPLWSVAGASALGRVTPVPVVKSF
jgi:alkylation response protein AidB-like acyl-CoA dehydrogenase